MAWQNFLGHEKIFDRFLRSHTNNRLASTYLFTGPDGIGKREFALRLAQGLFCKQLASELVGCDQCPSCVQVAKRAHPDLLLVSKPADKNFIPVELFLGDREHRRQKGLCHDIHLTPFSADRKIAIIDDADFLNAESANSLLKTLEEPPPNSILIMIGTSEHRQLPTILSRAQVIRFQALADQQLREILPTLELPGEIEMEKLIKPAAGSISRAILLDSETIFSFRDHLLGQLATLDPAQGGFSKTTIEFVEGMSKEASVRRKYLRLIADFTIQICSEAIRSWGAELEASSQSAKLNAALADAELASDIAADWIDRTIQFQSQIDSNTATANIVPLWLNDLGAIARREKILALTV